jgi:DNA repair exonuclease SbcCD ATPase subunit
MEAVAAASSILTLVAAITKLAKSLNEVRDSYNNVALNLTLVASSLSTIRAALEALHEWRANDRETADHSKQLDKDLEVSLSCCAILITVIDGKLSESGYKSGIKQRIRYVWLEDTLKEYLSNLEGQVRALQLLLTIYQCKTATEQRQKLERAESRRIIENVRSETQTLRTANKDFQDAASVLSLDPSVRFDFDSVLMTTPAYMNVYGQVSEIPSRYARRSH